jgi:immune inhibitor A
VPRHILFLLAVGVAALLHLASVGAQPGAITPGDTQSALRAAAPSSRDLALLAVEYGRSSPDVLAYVNERGAAVGQVDRFWIGRTQPADHFQVEAELRHVSRHALWYVQRGFTASDDALRRSGEMFDTTIYPGVRRLVGSEAFPGIDNEPRVVVFNGDVPGVAGYVTSADAYPSSVHPYSNEREVVYLNLRAQEAGTSSYYRTLAHELTHLVHWNVNASDDTWVKEGLGELVSSMVLSDRQLAASAFLSQPDFQLTAWSDDRVGLTPSAVHYQGASWFLRYFVDRYGEDAIAGVIARAGRGPGNFDRFFEERGIPQRFEDLFRSWVVANVIGDSDDPGVRAYTGSRPGQPVVERISGARTVDGTVAQFGVDYLELAGGQRWSLQFQGDATVSVVGTAPADGQGMWFAGRADTSHATMTRRFDLSGVESAFLSYRIWHDLEQDYDFAHVSASRDGVHWQLLTTPGMSAGNGTGNNLGSGYTGKSGGGALPEWVEERIDLSSLAGGPVWIRFQYLTDDAFLQEGVALDDVRIDAIGFSDGAEDPATGWDLQGWARVGELLPQLWSVQVVEFAEGRTTVTQVPIDAGGRGDWSSGGRTSGRTVVAISGLAPVTMQRAGYRATIQNG